MALSAGRLRHRVTIQRQTNELNSHGHVVNFWETVRADVAAAIEPLSAREFISAQTEQSKVTARIIIRYVSGIKPSMRVLHGSKIYNIEGVLSDLDSGLEYLTLPCSEGVNEG